MTSSNLSRIKTKFRTTGQVTGNFGRPKSRGGSTLSGIGLTDKENIKVALKSEYIARLYDAFDKTNDPRLKQFCYNEIKRYLITTGQWES